MIDKSLLERQSLEILALEERAKEQVLSTIRQAQAEIRQAIESKGSISNHLAELDREIQGILNRVDPKVGSDAFQVGVNQAVETVGEETGIWFGTPKLNLSALAAINLDTERRISGITDDLRRTVSDQLRISFALGEGISEATERIAGLGFRRSMWRYEMVARTVTNEMANQGHLSTYQAFNEQVPGLKLKKRYLSFVDHRTSAICQSLANEEREMDEPFSNGVQRPPSHPNCRSRITAITVRVPDSKQLEESNVKATPKTRRGKQPKPFTLKAGQPITDPELKSILDRGEERIKALADRIGEVQQKYNEMQRLAKQGLPPKTTSGTNQLERQISRAEKARRTRYEKISSEAQTLWDDIFQGRNNHPEIDKLLLSIRADNAFGDDTELVAKSIEKALRLAPNELGNRLKETRLTVNKTAGNFYSHSQKSINIDTDMWDTDTWKRRASVHETNHAIDDLLNRNPNHVKLALNLSEPGLEIQDIQVLGRNGEPEIKRMKFFNSEKLGVDKYSHRAYTYDTGKIWGCEFFEVASEGIVDFEHFFETVESADPNVIRYLFGSLNL